MSDDITEIALRSFQAYAESSRSANESVIAEDFRFTSPFDNGIDRKTYFERCWPNHKSIKSFRFVRAFSHGDEVFVTYEAKSTRGKVFRNTEILTVRGGKIVGVEVYFGWNVPHDASLGGFIDP